MSNKRPLRWIRALLMLLLTAVGLNWFTFAKARQYYLELNATRVDPFGLHDYPSTPLELSPGKVRVVFLGDSRAAQWPTPNDLSHFEFINRGIGAQTSTQVEQRFENHVIPLQPDIVILQMGINDLKTIPLFPRRRDVIVADCKENIRRIVEQSSHLGATVILTTIFPVGKISLERSFFWSPEVEQAIIEVNDYIRSLSAENVVVFDTYALLVGQDGHLRPLYAADFLHLKREGYKQLNEQLAPVLQTIKR